MMRFPGLRAIPLAANLATVAFMSCYGQTVPVMTMGPHKTGAEPATRRIQVNTPSATSKADRHQQSLEELRKIVGEATALQRELQADGPEKVSAESMKRVSRMRRSIRLVESGLFAK